MMNDAHVWQPYAMLAVAGNGNACWHFSKAAHGECRGRGSSGTWDWAHTNEALNN